MAASAEGSSSNTLVPDLGECGITTEDLATAIRVLDAISSLDPKKRKQQKRKQQIQSSSAGEEKKEAGSEDHNNNEDNEDGLDRYRRSDLRQFRKSLSSCLLLHQRTMYEGKSEKEYYDNRLTERTLKRQKMAESVMQQKYVASTDLRKGRVEKLEKLQDDCKDEEEARVRLLQYLVPDGHVDTIVTGRKMLENGTSSTAEKEECDDDLPPSTSSITTVLPKLRSCYSCKVRFRNMHHFYDQLCETCAPYNYTKRHQTANMVGKIAIVTGSRVKIGFQVCLKLLRAGATVVATTRFPNNAVSSYRRESDFETWRDRLKVYGLDLRDVIGLEAFTRYLRVTYGNIGIDILINNACQTVRRPGGYYAPLVQKEEELWRSGDEAHRFVLQGCIDFERIRRSLVVTDYSSRHDVHATIANNRGSFPTLGPSTMLFGGGNDTSSMLDTNTEFDPAAGEKCHDIIAKQKQTISTKNDDDDYVPFESTGIAHSAAMSQITILPDDIGVNERVMPKGLSDINGQQLDLRTQNSWLLKMDEVTTPELLECMFVNAIAPFVLNSRLKPLMEAPADDPSRPDRYIINVSAMEGKFYRYKMPNHPHTNMAKAALNMLTRTSSEDLAKRSRIYMNSVDTGWINDENPLEKASKIAVDNNFQTPIDEIDAAARILDPVFVGIKVDDGAPPGYIKAVKDYGKFFKDYKESNMDLHCVKSKAFTGSVELSKLGSIAG